MNVSILSVLIGIAIPMMKWRDYRLHSISRLMKIATYSISTHHECDLSYIIVFIQPEDIDVWCNNTDNISERIGYRVRDLI